MENVDDNARKRMCSFCERFLKVYSPAAQVLDGILTDRCRPLRNIVMAAFREDVRYAALRARENGDGNVRVEVYFPRPSALGEGEDDVFAALDVGLDRDVMAAVEVAAVKLTKKLVVALRLTGGEEAALWAALPERYRPVYKK